MSARTDDPTRRDAQPGTSAGERACPPSDPASNSYTTPAAIFPPTSARLTGYYRGCEVWSVTCGTDSWWQLFPVSVN